MASKFGKSSSLLKKSCFNASRASAASNELTANWLRRLGATAHSSQARETHSQLSSVLDYYNSSQTAKALDEIEWDKYRNVIHTPNIVNKLQAKYDGFAGSTFSVDSAVSRCGGTTEKMQALDIAMKWNFKLYLAHYMGHLTQMEMMHNIGDIQEMSVQEMIKLCPGVECMQSMQQEIGNLAPDSYHEEQVVTRVCSQFSWGTKHNPPFTHSQDTISCIASTLGKLGK